MKPPLSSLLDLRLGSIWLIPVEMKPQRKKAKLAQAPKGNCPEGAAGMGVSLTASGTRGRAASSDSAGRDLSCEQAGQQRSAAPHSVPHFSHSTESPPLLGAVADLGETGIIGEWAAGEAFVRALAAGAFGRGDLSGEGAEAKTRPQRGQELSPSKVKPQASHWLDGGVGMGSRSGWW